MNLQTYLSKLLRGIHLGPVLPHVFLKCSKKNIQNNVNERYNVSVPLRGSKSITIQWTRPTTTLFMRPHSFDLSGDILPFNSDTLEGHWEGGGWGHWRGLSLNCISKQLADKLSTTRICKDYPPAFLTPKNQAKEQIWNYPCFLFFLAFLSRHQTDKRLAGEESPLFLRHSRSRGGASGEQRGNEGRREEGAS